MASIKNTASERAFWSLRYEEQQTGWDIGHPSRPIKEYIDQIKDKQKKILIPGAGNAYEAEYLFNKGFENIFVLDIAEAPLKALKKRIPHFPSDQLILENFFNYEGKFDLILEQTFFCSFPPIPEYRATYAQKMHDLLRPNGKLVGLWFDFPLTEDLEKRPFGGTKEEYLSYFTPYFEVLTFEKSTNSIEPRKDTELFGIFRKK